MNEITLKEKDEEKGDEGTEKTIKKSIKTNLMNYHPSVCHSNQY